MSSRTSGLAPRRTAAALAVGVALSAALVTGQPASGAPARAAAEPASTPVTMPTPDGAVSSYLLNARHANPGQTRLLERAVERSGGVVVQTWPAIGVVVAHSTNGSFRSDVTSAAGQVLDSVGATRSVPVTEGTPAGVQAPWGPGASGRGSGQAKKQARGDVGSEQTTATTPDPRESEQWDLRMIKADRAHAITDGSRRVVVGVLDSGIDPDHPDLASNIDVADSVNCSDAGRPDTSPGSWYPTTSDHGTHVAGTIGAARNGVGIVGVAPGVRMASVKVVNDAGFIYPEYAVCGFMWAAERGMDVTNNSYYVDPFEYYCDDQPDQHAAKEAVRRAVAWSIDRGVVSAAAAGNAATDLATNTRDETSPDDAATPTPRDINSTCEDIPTELPGVVTVSSVQRFPAGTDESRLSSFSNRGLGKIDVAAPGSSILSTIVAGNGYGLKSGTSMASPHVAGVLALMKSVHPTWTPAQMVAKLRAQADDKPCGTTTAGPACVGTPADNSFFGEGMVDALDAVS
ncbi:MAG: peptidase [Marmoricola sp.]|nr:peptidase [Marmoricola sp.]